MTLSSKELSNCGTGNYGKRRKFSSQSTGSLELWNGTLLSNFQQGNSQDAKYPF